MLPYIVLGISSLFLILIIILLYMIFNKLKLMRYYENYEKYISLLNYHTDMCYKIIYKDKLLIYSIEATKASDEQMIEYSKDFINLVIKMIGINMYNIFVEIYGDDVTFYKNLIDYFNDKYDHDEIRQESIDSLKLGEQI